MAIVYYPNRVYKKNSSPIDVLMKEPQIISVKKRQDISSTAMDEIIYRNNDWTQNSLRFNFSNATARNYSAKILTGTNVIQNLNDYFWMEYSEVGKQKITLDSGFYNSGTTLSAEIKSKLDNNAAFLAAGAVFTVTYSVTTGLFSITVNTGTIRYLNVNLSQTVSNRDSIGGHLFGFNSDSALASTITSDTAVFGLGDEVAFINQTNETALEHLFDDVKYFNVDQALHIAANVAGVAISFEVNSRDIN